MIQRIIVGHYDRTDQVAAGAEPRVVRPLDMEAVAALLVPFRDAEANQAQVLSGGGRQWLGRIRGENVWSREAGDLSCPWRNEEGINRGAARFAHDVGTSLGAVVYQADYGFFQNASHLLNRRILTPPPSLLTTPHDLQGGRTLVWINLNRHGRRLRHFADVLSIAGAFQIRTRCGLETSPRPHAFRIIESPAQYMEDTPIGRFCDKCRICHPRPGADLAAWVEQRHPDRPAVLERLRVELLKTPEPASVCLAFSDWFEERGDAVGTALFRLRGGSICGADLQLLFKWLPERQPEASGRPG